MADTRQYHQAQTDIANITAQAQQIAARLAAFTINRGLFEGVPK